METLGQKINFEDIKEGDRLAFESDGSYYPKIWELTVEKIANCSECGTFQRRGSHNFCHKVQLYSTTSQRFCSYKQRQFYLKSDSRINKVTEL